MSINWDKLTEPLAKGYKWKVNNSNKAKTSVLCVPYADARDYENRLDEILTPSGWQDAYYQVKGTLFCKIGIKVGDEWIWKSGAGVEKKSYNNDMEIKLKGEASDAFKLAGVKWGIFRDLYDFDGIWLKAKRTPNDKAIPVDEVTGKEIKQHQLTEHINMRLTKGYKPEPKKEEDKKIIKEDSNNDWKIEALDAINESFTQKKISETTKDEMVADCEDIVSKDGFTLVISKLDLMDTYRAILPFLSEFEKKDYKKKIKNVTLDSVVSLTDEVGKLYNGRKKAGRR